MINLQAQGKKIIDSNILQSMLNEVGRCKSCGEQKLQITENVNKRIGVCENPCFIFPQKRVRKRR